MATTASTVSTVLEQVRFSGKRLRIMEDLAAQIEAPETKRYLLRVPIDQPGRDLTDHANAIIFKRPNGFGGFATGMIASLFNNEFPSGVFVLLLGNFEKSIVAHLQQNFGMDVPNAVSDDVQIIPDDTISHQIRVLYADILKLRPVKIHSVSEIL